MKEREDERNSDSVTRCELNGGRLTVKSRLISLAYNNLMSAAPNKYIQKCVNAGDHTLTANLNTVPVSALTANK